MVVISDERTCHHKLNDNTCSMLKLIPTKSYLH